MNINYTSIEQSKKLLELGLSPESADRWYNIDIVDKFGIDGYNNIPSFEKVSDVDISCWSVGQLMQLMPKSTRLLKSSTNESYHCSSELGLHILYFIQPLLKPF